MKIGILTHPQSINYGGILQCYALCTQLRKMGHEPIVIRRESNKQLFLWEWLRALLKVLHSPRYYNPNEIDRMKNILPFIEKNLVRTAAIRSQKQMAKVCQDYQFDAVIVGSDQVWRKDYAMNFSFNYFLDFVPAGIKKISYAASFGLSEWQYDDKQSCRIQQLLKEYIGVSVRESEAVYLLKDNIGIDSIQLVDPTMLLDAKEYSKIASPRLINENYVFVYWLGAKDGVVDVIKSLVGQGGKIVTMFLREEQVQMSVEDWLSYIKYADNVITDSFHGSVFSIIFKRQFTVLKNDSGGNSRITSLCKLLGINMNTTKNYEHIQNAMQNKQKEAKNFLHKTLE